MAQIKVAAMWVYETARLQDFSVVFQYAKDRRWGQPRNHKKESSMVIHVCYPSIC